MSATTCSTSAVRKLRVFSARDWVLFAALSGARVAAYSYFAWNWCLAAPLWRHETGAMLAATLLVAIILMVDVIRWCALPFMSEPAPMAPRPGWRVAVVTTCVPGLEPPSFLEPTLRALVSLDYPHDTYLLDEGDDPRLRLLCTDLGIVHYSRKGSPEYQSRAGAFASGTKHGNYNSWLAEIGFRNYDILLAFDPDHIPVTTYASAVLGYFSDPAVGYVQCPQAYRNQGSSWIARGAAEESYAYYSIVQRAAFGVSDPVVTGCHSAHRLAALQQIGGFPDHDAEDLLATARYHEAGWRGTYVPKVQARGLAPENWKDYLNQQFRWARSVLDIKVRQLPAHRGLKNRAFAWLQGFGYLHDAILATLGLTLFCARLATGWGAQTFLRLHTRPALALFVILWSTNLYKRFFRLDRDQERGCYWRAMLLRVGKWPRILQAYWSVIVNRRTDYVVTPKTKAKKPSRPQLGTIAAVAIAVAGSWASGMVLQTGIGPAAHIWSAVVLTAAIALFVSELLESRT